MITEGELNEAVSAFWGGRLSGTQAATHDRAFLELIARELRELGWESHIAQGVGDAAARIGGHFRASKSWDIVCRDADGELRVCVEFKSQVDSYGNNENNRYEEALGSGLDARARYGADVALGFLFVLCEEAQSTRPTRLVHPEILADFKETSHIDRRATFARRIVDFQMNEMPFYDASAVLAVSRDGNHRHLDDPLLDIRTFPERLIRRLSAAPQRPTPGFD